MHVAEYTKGGVATYLENVITFQKKHSEISKVYLVCSAVHATHFEEMEDAKFQLLKYDYKRHPRHFWSAIKKISEYIESVSPDIVHIHSSFAGMFVRLPYFIKRKKVKIVYCSHGWSFLMDTSNLRKRLYAFIEKMLSIKTDKIINISKYEYKNSIKYGISEEKSIVILNGISNFSNNNHLKNGIDLKINKNKINLLFVGRFDRQKGLDILINFFHKYHINHIELYVIGESVIGDLNFTFPDNVKHLGWVSNQLMDQYYKQFDAVIMPSRWEGFGLVAIEAMKNKVPVIASNRGALPEIVEHDNNGYIFDLSKEEELLNILNQLDKEQLKQMGLKGYETFKKKFSSKIMNESILDVYRQLLDTTAASPKIV
ncbi:glycosyltransferase [[Anoxybacillus] calidus]|nr:glycosyltransferase [Anoxybacillus calidus]